MGIAPLVVESAEFAGAGTDGVTGKGSSVSSPSMIPTPFSLVASYKANYRDSSKKAWDMPINHLECLRACIAEEQHGAHISSSDVKQLEEMDKITRERMSKIIGIE